MPTSTKLTPLVRERMSARGSIPAFVMFSHVQMLLGHHHLKLSFSGDLLYLRRREQMVLLLAILNG